MLLHLLGPYALGMIVLALVPTRDPEKWFYLMSLLPALGMVVYTRRLQKSGAPISIGGTFIATGISFAACTIAFALGYFLVCKRYFSWYTLTHDAGWILILAFAFFTSMVTLRLMEAARKRRL